MVFTFFSGFCANEWDPLVCKKPTIKCKDCQHRSFISLSKQVIYDHLSGKVTAGIYPLYTDDTCSFLAIDFDKQEWQEDVKALIYHFPPEDSLFNREKGFSPTIRGR